MGNSGFVMGPISALREVLAGIGPENWLRWEAAWYSHPDYWDDQGAFIQYMFENLHGRDLVSLDYSGSLVVNMAHVRKGSVLEIEDGSLRNKATGAIQCFAHF